jgi:hypothetical protein
MCINAVYLEFMARAASQVFPYDPGEQDEPLHAEDPAKKGKNRKVCQCASHLEYLGFTLNHMAKGKEKKHVLVPLRW